MIQTVAVTDRFGGTLYKIVNPSIPLTIRATWDPEIVPLMAPPLPTGLWSKWLATGLAIEELEAAYYIRYDMRGWSAPPAPPPSS